MRWSHIAAAMMSVGLLCFAVYVIVVAATKYSSLGSIIAVLFYPVILFITAGFGLHNFAAIFIALFIVYLHRSNIKRLLNGNENKMNY